MFFLFVPPRSLGRSSPNLEGKWRAAPNISLRGSFFEGQGHRGQRSNLCVFFLFVPLLLHFKDSVIFFSFSLCMSYLRLCVCVCMCVSYLSSSPQSSYCYVETGKIY